MDRIGFALALWCVANLAAVGLWDVYAVFGLQDTTVTASYYIQTWATKFPVGALAVGVIIGHLIWSQPPRDR